MAKKYSVKVIAKAIKDANDNFVEHDKRIAKENKTFHLVNVRENLPLCARNNVQKKWYRLWGWIGCWQDSLDRINCKKCIEIRSKTNE